MVLDRIQNKPTSPKKLQDNHLTPKSKDCKWCITLNENDEFTLNKYGDNYLRQDWHIYILLLEECNWYVGLTKNICTRIRHHFLGMGAKWTKKYRPIAIHKIQTFNPKNSKKKMQRIESLFTLFYMDLHGIEAVRGGWWCSSYTLTALQRNTVKKKISEMPGIHQ